MKKNPVSSLFFIATLLLFFGACSSSPTSTGRGSDPSAATAGHTPVITGFMPAWQYVGSMITISGSNFDTVAANNTVVFSGTQAKVAAATDTSLAVIVPSGATIGQIMVTTAGGTAASSTSFVVMSKGGSVTIAGFSPAAATVGSSVTINGSGFNPVEAHNIVTFNGTQAVVTAASATSLVVTVPDAVNGNITVTTPAGTAISHNTFALVPAESALPLVKSFTPLRGAAGTTVVTISGINFDATPGNNVVQFNGAQAVVSSGTTTSLEVTVPAGAGSGPITVTNAAGVTTRSAAAFTITSSATIPGLVGGSIQGNNLDLLGTALTFAGGGVYNSATDGTGLNARFNNPNGITTDGTNLYVTDSGNRIIRKIEIATGKVTTLAGSGVAGSKDGTGTGASFSTPNGITTDGTSLFVADTGNNRIRKISPLPGTGTLDAMTSSNASVTTIAGTGSMVFKDDPIGIHATFKGPYGIATDNTNLYVADGFNRIRKINIATTAVTTLAGNGKWSSVDGTGTDINTGASFYRPRGITISPDRTTLYVADYGTNVIRQIDIATATVTTLAGVAGVTGSMDSIGAAASFQNPNGITTDGTSLYVADSGNQRIRKIIITSQVVSTVTGSSAPGATNGSLTTALFRIPNGIIMAGTDLYVLDSGNNLIRKIDLSAQQVSTFAGNVAIQGSEDGIGLATKFNFPYGITSDGTNLYIADSGTMVIRKIVISTGVVTRLAGSGMSQLLVAGGIDATGVSASFNYPMGITTDGVNLYVVDAENQSIRQIVIATGEVTTLAGSGAYGSTDAVGRSATFSQPYAITTAGDNLYIADTGSNKIRKLVISTGEVSTLAGSGAVGATDDAIGTAATFNHPRGIATDGTNLYVADTDNNKIRKIEISTGAVTTLAGSGNYWNDDLFDTVVQEWIGAAANFRKPAGITTDGINLYVADADNNEIRKITPATGTGTLATMTSANATVTTLAGSGVFGDTDGTGSEANFSQPVGITTDGKNLYTTEYLNNLIRQIQ